MASRNNVFLMPVKRASTLSSRRRRSELCLTFKPVWSASRWSSHPQAHPGPVAAAAIGRDEQRSGLGINGLPHRAPPAADGSHGEAGRVVIDSHAHPARVAGEVVDPVGDGLAVLFDLKLTDSGSADD